MLGPPCLPGPRLQAGWLLDNQLGAAHHTVTSPWLDSPLVLWVRRKSFCFSNLQLSKWQKTSLKTFCCIMKYICVLSFVLLWSFCGSYLMAPLSCSQILVDLIRHGIKSNNHAHGNTKTPPVLYLRWLIFHHHYYVNSKKSSSVTN